MRHLTALQRCTARIPWEQLPREGALATTALAEWLYAEYFIGWRPSAQPRVDYAGSPWFVAELNARCGGPSTFEPGFRVLKHEEGGTFVHNAAMYLWVADTRALRPRDAKAGQVVEVAMPCAREAAIPGFFTIVSRAGHPDRAKPHLKFYVNATPEGALLLLQGLLQGAALRTAQFGAKVTNDPAHFGRRDTLLVYVTPAHAPRVADYLSAFARRRPRALLDQTPPMTVQLARGIAVAESPRHHAESFGAHRCRLIAEGLLTARAEHRAARDAISERYERDGIDWNAPWFGALARGWLTRLTG